MTRPFSPMAAAFVLAACASPVLADRATVLVFDASGSMWTRVEGDLSRIEVAPEVMGDYFTSRDGNLPLSVIAYGHNRRGDCADIEVVAPMGQAAPADLEARLRALMPRGMTPLTDSLRLARDQIPLTAEAADIILVTDGLETCAGDPCTLAAELAADGIDIRAHVVGFGLTRPEVEALSCITEQTGGLLFETNSGAGLVETLQQVSAAAPEAAPQPEPEPAPARAAEFDIGAKAEEGFAHSIGWTGAARFIESMGFVPQGESGDVAGASYGTIGGTEAAPNNPVTRTAPVEPGLYDLIIVSATDGVIARQPVEVVAPQMGFEAGFRDIGASVASGSFRHDGMIVAPCSVKTLGAIAHCMAGDLITRAADVCLKERRRLVLLFRETPLHAGHIDIMARATASGAIVMPAVLGLYYRPQSVDDVIDHLAGRALDLLGIEAGHVRRWTGARLDPEPSDRNEGGQDTAREENDHDQSDTAGL